MSGLGSWIMLMLVYVRVCPGSVLSDWPTETKMLMPTPLRMRGGALCIRL